MILILECILACFLFTCIFVGGVLYKKEAFLHEYAPAVQQRFLEMNPEFVPADKTKNIISIVIGKCLGCILLSTILTILVYFAGAKSFKEGVLYGYIIWFVVNWFDVVALDIGVFAHWKKVRLAGTEDMDQEYMSNAGKSIIDGFIGMAIGIPVSLLCGYIISRIM